EPLRRCGRWYARVRGAAGPDGQLRRQTMTDTVAEAFRYLRKREDIDTVTHVTSFDVYVHGEGGNVHRVRLGIPDAGEVARPAFRYRCVARSENGTRTGSTADTVATALAILHFPEPS